ncbi:peroxidase [Nephila pilipes]|uniref:Peroxidase n=1 Tax=Nephila pilipes TaxID=299642 RepID=A0A8X6UD27_NEPPI|nr:peroxidase [Nephila pilipes]
MTLRKEQKEYNILAVPIPENPNECQENTTFHCDSTYPYRTMNGTCNNLDHPTWGSTNECYLRFQPAFYDGYGNYRKSVEGGALPKLRDITLNIFTNVHRPSSKLSFMFTVYGQTVAHDLSRAVIMNLTVPCCSPENENEPSCMHFSIRSNDPFYSQFNLTCLEMHRSQPCTICNTTNREQINGVTSALDASLVYGENEKLAQEIRANDGTGVLRSIYTKQGELLPIDKNPSLIFCPLEIESKCFLAGDIRANQHSTLTSMQTLYMREHNRLAMKLKVMNSHWDEERLYQEARRINIAQLQCITFKEYLPLLLGPTLIKEFDLSIKDGSSGSKYNSNIRLGVRSEFAIAVFRLHSMIPKNVGFSLKKFKNLYFNPDLIRTEHLGEILQGVCQVPSEKYDYNHVEDVTNFMARSFQTYIAVNLVSLPYLGYVLRGRNCSIEASKVFEPLDVGIPGTPYGHDLSSVDIQRGRDHGLAPYIHMVRFCSEGLINISSFRDLSPLLMSKKSAALLEENYAAVEDIDLWVGVQMEHAFPDSEVGPTAACIIAKQFYSTKFGDRFFFEHEGEVPSFTSVQRKSLKKCSLSRLLCDNTRITQIQKNVMLLPSVQNPEIPCDDIAEIDLMPWTETTAE